MLHLAGRVSFGVDVADLFELEGALHGHRILDAPAQVEEVVVAVKLVGQPLELRLPLGHLAGQIRHTCERFQEPAHPLLID